MTTPSQEVSAADARCHALVCSPGSSFWHRHQGSLAIFHGGGGCDPSPDHVQASAAASGWSLLRCLSDRAVPRDLDPAARIRPLLRGALGQWRRPRNSHVAVGRTGHGRPAPQTPCSLDHQRGRPRRQPGSGPDHRPVSLVHTRATIAASVEPAGLSLQSNRHGISDVQLVQRTAIGGPVERSRLTHAVFFGSTGLGFC